MDLHDLHKSSCRPHEGEGGGRTPGPPGQLRRWLLKLRALVCLVSRSVYTDRQNFIFITSHRPPASLVVTHLHRVSNNAPTLTSCHFNKHWLILTIFSKHYQHTFKNDMRIHISLSLHFYLLYWLLSSCDGNGAFWGNSVLVKQSSSFSRKHRILSLQICVHQTVRLTWKPGLLQNLAADAGMCEPRHMSAIYQRLDAAPRWQMGKYIIKRRSCCSMEKAVVCIREGKMTSLWTSAKLKPAFFQSHQQSTEENTLFCVLSIAPI